MNRMPNTTPEVIREAMEGSTQAFRMLVEENQAFAYRVALRFVGQAAEAEDIVQEAFVSLWQNLHKFRTEMKLTTWLYRIIANRCLDYLKSTKGKQRKNQLDMEHGNSVAGYLKTDGDLENQELMKAIQETAASLTPRQRAVFILRDLENLPVEEVCNILEMPAGHVKSNLYYARKAMSEKLKVYYQTDTPIRL